MTSTTKFSSERMSRLGIEEAFVVLSKAKELERKGAKIIHFEIGEPDFDTPEHIRRSAIEALKQGYTHYTPTLGMLELREAIAEVTSEEYNIDVDPQREVIVMPGAKPGIFNTVLATINPGDEVIIPNPGFPTFGSVVEFVGGVPVYVPLREENDFRIRAEDIENKITEKTKMLILNSPENPCGSVLTKGDVEAIAEIAIKNNLLVISDEIYRKIIYDGRKHYSIMSEPGMKERTILLDGFSKTYAMTGWRIGYAIANERIIEHLSMLQNNSVSCVTAFVQRAGIEALRGPQDCVKEMVKEYERRRNVIVPGINKIPGFSCKNPMGAFYVFANIKELNLKAYDLMIYLLEKASVATLHGPAMGKFAEGYLRFAYATSVENIKTGLQRIREAIEKLSL